MRRGGREGVVLAQLLRQQAQQAVRRQRAHAGVRGQRLAVHEADAGDAPALHDERVRRPVEQHVCACAREPLAHGVAHDGGEARPGEADVAPVPVAQQRLLEEHEPCARGDVLGVVVQRGDDEQVPERGDGPLRLPVRPQPAVERLPPERGTVAVALDPHEEQRGYRAEPLGEADVRVAQQRRQQVERRWQGKAGEDAAPAGRRAHLDAQPLLAARQFERADLVEEAPVGVAAAEEDVLAVVDLLAGLAVDERVRPAAEVRPALHERHAAAGVDEPPRSGHARQPAPEHCDGGQRFRTPRSRAVVHSLHVSLSFSQDERPTRSEKTSQPREAIRCSKRL